MDKPLLGPGRGGGFYPYKVRLKEGEPIWKWKYNFRAVWRYFEHFGTGTVGG
jgi:hypothetical protein